MENLICNKCSSDFENIQQSEEMGYNALSCRKCEVMDKTWVLPKILLVFIIKAQNRISGGES